MIGCRGQKAPQPLLVLLRSRRRRRDAFAGGSRIHERVGDLHSTALEGTENSAAADDRPHSDVAEIVFG